MSAWTWWAKEFVSELCGSIICRAFVSLRGLNEWAYGCSCKVERMEPSSACLWSWAQMCMWQWLQLQSGVCGWLQLHTGAYVPVGRNSTSVLEQNGWHCYTPCSIFFSMIFVVAQLWGTVNQLTTSQCLQTPGISLSCLAFAGVRNEFVSRCDKAVLCCSGNDACQVSIVLPGPGHLLQLYRHI